MAAYATVDDLIIYIGEPATGEVPPRVMIRASAQVDRALVGARYDVDDVGQPTDPAVVGVLRDATCAQARALLADDARTLLSGEAWDVLRAAGLVPVQPRVTG